jgi:hypothetical protein
MNSIKQRKGPFVAIAVVVVLLLVALGFGIRGFQQRVADDKAADAAVDRLQDDLQDLQKAAAEPGTPIATIAEADDTPADVVSQGTAIARRLTNEIIAVRNAYHQRLSEIGVDTLLDPARLKADAGYVDSRRRIADCREALATLRADALAALDRVPAFVAESKLGPAEQREFIEGYETTKAASLSGLEANFALEGQAIDKLEALVEHLAAVPWENDPAGILFASDADAETYNRLLAELGEIVAKQQADSAKAMQTAQDAIGKLKDL